MACSPQPRAPHLFKSDAHQRAQVRCMQVSSGLMPAQAAPLPCSYTETDYAARARAKGSAAPRPPVHAITHLFALWVDHAHHHAVVLKVLHNLLLLGPLHGLPCREGEEAGWAAQSGATMRACSSVLLTQLPPTGLQHDGHAGADGSKSAVLRLSAPSRPARKRHWRPPAPPQLRRGDNQGGSHGRKCELSRSSSKTIARPGWPRQRRQPARAPQVLAYEEPLVGAHQLQRDGAHEQAHTDGAERVPVGLPSPPGERREEAGQAQPRHSAAVLPQNGCGRRAASIGAGDHF